MDYRVVDADTHTVEPPDMWRRFLPAKYQDQAPTLVKDPRGGDAWKFGIATPRAPCTLSAITKETVKVTNPA